MTGSKEENRIKKEIQILECDIEDLKRHIERYVIKVKEKKELVRYFKNQL